MKKSLLHIVLPLTLAIAVNDYVWIQYLQDNQTYVEVESQEILEEGEEPEQDNDFGSSSRFFADSQIIIPSHSCILNPHKMLTIRSGRADQRLFILYQQLKLHCRLTDTIVSYQFYQFSRLKKPK